MLSELVSKYEVQQDLFSANQTGARTTDLMGVLDAINNKMGRDSIKLASEGFKRPWRMKQNNKSPSYTTDWGAVVIVSNDS